LLSGEKTSAYITYATPPYAILALAELPLSARPTVRIAPSMMKLKLNVCCVVLAAFSLAVRSPHGILPSSLKAVTAFLLGGGVVLVVPKPVCAAYNRAARIGRRLGGHFSRDRGRAREFILRDLGLALKIELRVFPREVRKLHVGK